MHALSVFSTRRTSLTDSYAAVPRHDLVAASAPASSATCGPPKDLAAIVAGLPLQASARRSASAAGVASAPKPADCTVVASRHRPSTVLRSFERAFSVPLPVAAEGSPGLVL